MTIIMYIVVYQNLPSIYIDIIKNKLSFILMDLQSKLVRTDFPNFGQTYTGLVVNPRPQTLYRQQVTAPETFLQNILVGNVNTIQGSPVTTSSIRRYQISFVGKIIKIMIARCAGTLKYIYSALN